MMRVCGEDLAKVGTTHKKYAFDDLENAGKVKDPNGWLTTGILMSSTCKRKGTRGRKPIHGSLQYFLDLGSENGPNEGVGEAAIAIIWVSSELYYPYEANEFLHWPYLDDHELRDDRLFCWFDADYPVAPFATGCWFYVVPLVAVKTRADVTRLLVSPMLALIDGQPVSTAFADAPEVSRFNAKRELEALGRDFSLRFASSS
ncbi:hypothetical protein [Microvirga aerophila]|uniref:Uncharacterized protein n=1 Tax=Microvirga aerophila TaxID=670291 RepID=A0A512C430_9HYPH|nr:hypothetical protein [Microvirga aerophila]GEO18969.1 hypothetical protein MAE02_66650 [Microvirga aerophila]